MNNNNNNRNRKIKIRGCVVCKNKFKKNDNGDCEC
jgi:hypothetical protein